MQSYFSKLFALAVCLIMLAQPLLGQSEKFNSLFSDYKAHQTGDILTIYIVEFSSGSNNSSARNKSENDLNVESSGGQGALKFIPLFGVSSKYGNEYKGEGQISQAGQLRAKMSARIVEVDQNGNIKIEGKKITEINGDKQTIVLSGWVRPEDITADNVVYSYNIADAQISYEGHGPASSAPKPGWITRLLEWIF